MLEIKPNNVAIIPLYDPDVTKGGLVIPASAQTRSDQGIVKYVGRDCKWLRVGDWVLFSGWSGNVVEIDGEGRLIFMHEKQVEAVVHEQIDELVGGLWMQESNGNFIKPTWEFVCDMLAHNASILCSKYRMNGDPTKYREREQRMRANAYVPTDDES